MTDHNKKIDTRIFYYHKNHPKTIKATLVIKRETIQATMDHFDKVHGIHTCARDTTKAYHMGKLLGADDD